MNYEKWRQSLANIRAHGNNNQGSKSENPRLAKVNPNDSIGNGGIAAWEINGSFLNDKEIKLITIKAWFKQE